MAVQSHYPVVIIGAGPTGVTAATLLGQYGIECLVLDRWGDVYPQPRAVHLDDEVYRILERLGVGREFADISRPGLGLRLLDTDMTVLAEFHRDPTRSRHGHPAANMFDQPELEAVLRANLKRFPAATLRGDSEVGTLTDIPGGRTRIGFTDRIDESEHVVDCDYLLGCDGANSMTREHIGAVMGDLRFEQRWLVVDVESRADLNQWGGVHQVCNPLRAGTFMQLKGSRYRWEFRLLPGETAADYRTLASLRPLIAPWLGSTADSDLEVIRVADYTFRAQVADRWHRGNTFLLGDAAHLTPPFIGQGMGAGLRDAMNLGWKLAGVLKGSLDADVLDTYEQERKPHVRAMIRLALVIGHSMTAGGRIGDALRRTLAPRMHRVPGLATTLLDSATPPLHRSTLVDRGRGRKRLSGSLCPNVTTSTGDRLDTVLGNGFAVITAVKPDQRQRSLIQQRNAVVHYAAPGTALAEWLGGAGEQAVIVRPDFSVMRAGGLSELCQSLPAF